jgi:hypothetical protein
MFLRVAFIRLVSVVPIAFETIVFTFLPLALVVPSSSSAGSPLKKKI